MVVVVQAASKLALMGSARIVGGPLGDEDMDETRARRGASLEHDVLGQRLDHGQVIRRRAGQCNAARRLLAQLPGKGRSAVAGSIHRSRIPKALPARHCGQNFTTWPALPLGRGVN